MCVLAPNPFPSSPHSILPSCSFVRPWYRGAVDRGIATETKESLTALAWQRERREGGRKWRIPSFSASLQRRGENREKLLRQLLPLSCSFYSFFAHHLLVPLPPLSPAAYSKVSSAAVLILQRERGRRGESPSFTVSDKAANSPEGGEKNLTSRTSNKKY